MMLKQELRKMYKEKRMGLSFSQKEKLSDMLLISFQRLPIEIPSVIMTFSPIEKMNEFDPAVIASYCSFKNPQARFVYTVMDENKSPENRLRTVLVNDDTVFAENKYNIYEPVDGVEIDVKDIDMVITPLLCFDRSGNRVGYGKGYYDSFFTNCRKDCIKIGFSFFDPVDGIADVNEFDVPLDHCITPETIYTFTK